MVILHSLMLLLDVVLRMLEISTSLLFGECMNVHCSSHLEILLEESLQVNSVLLRSGNSQYNHGHGILVALLITLGVMLLLVVMMFSMVIAGKV